MRLMQWRRQPWRVDLAFLLTLCLLFLPAWVGLQPGNEARVAAQPPAPVATRPILVVPFQAAEGVPTGVTEGVTFALVEELEASRQFSPTRLSLDEPTIQRLIREGQLTEDAVTDVLQQPTPEGIAQIASAMKVADAVYGTVDSYTYDPKANGGVVRVKVTARFLKVDPTTGAVTETKEISKEGSSAPKLAPRPEKELASEAFRNAVRQIVSEFLGLPAPPPPPPPPKAISPLPVLIGLLLLGALIGAGRGRAAPPAPPIAPGPANAPSRVAAIPQGQAILVTWQIPTQGTPLGYNVYRADAGPALPARQADNFQRLNTAPITRTDYLDTQAERGKLYLYAVTAVYSNNVESERAFANADITGQPVPVGIGVPLPPSNLQAQPGDSLVRLTWEDPNPSGIVRGYRIYRGTNAPPTDANLIADETTVRTTTFTDRGLSNGTTYFYVVRAVSTQGFLSVPSAVVPATPGNLAPQPPTLSGQFNPNAKTVTLTWTPSPDPDIAYYEVARIVKDISRSRALTTRVTRQTPIINLSPGVARRILQTNPRLRQTASEFDANVIASNITATSFVENVAQFSPSGTAPTIYKELHYAVRAVDQSGQRSPWSNVVVITPNSPPPSLATLRPKVIPGNGQVTIDLLPLLTAANQDPQFGSEWQVDKKGVRIFRTTTKGGTSAAALPPINSPDPLPLENLRDGRYFPDTQVTNGTRYFYAVELVDKLGVAGGRSQETAATPFASASLLIAAQGNRTELSGNGQDRVQLTVSVIDTNNRPIAGFPLLFSLTGQGTLTVDSAYRDPEAPQDDKRAVTDENGQAIATYQAPSVAADTTATIGAQPIGITGVAEVSLTLTIRAPRVASIEVRPQKTQLTADGLDVTDVTITVRDTLGQPVPNKTVNLAVIPPDPTNFGRFENPSGNPITQATTDEKGEAKVRYRSGKRTGSVTLQASVTEGAAFISGQAIVTLVPGSPASIELVANPSSASADGSSEVRVTATVKDAQGNAVPRVQVQFSATPTLTITPSVATTDDTGQATVTVTAPTQAGVYTLQARVGNIAATIALTFSAGSAATITLSASRTDLLVSLPPTYGTTDYTNLLPFSTAEIRATVLDGNGNRIPNIVVQFSASAGTIQQTAITDSSGIAKAIYIAPVGPPGQVTITAAAGTAQGTLQLNILPGPAAKVRVTASPLVLPMDGRSQSQVRAEVLDANGNKVTDGTSVTFQLNPTVGQLLETTLPTSDGVAITSYIAPAATNNTEVTISATARSVVFGNTFQTDPNDPFSQPRVIITLGAQVQIDRTSLASEIAVSSSDTTTNPDDRQSLRSRSPTNNFSDLTIKLVNGQGQPIARSGVQVTVRSSDSRVLFVDSVAGNRSLGLLPASTDNAGQVRLRLYASSTAGTVSITAELRDQQGNVFSSDSVTITQRPGDPYQITMPLPQPNILFVPGAGTPNSTTITAQVRDKVNNLVEAGVPVTFEARLEGESVGILSPSTTTTDANGTATTTLTSTLNTGFVTVTAQTSPAVPQPGSTTVAFVTGVTQISVAARDPQIGGDDNDAIPDFTTITANFVGTIPNGTKVTFTTTRGTFNQTQLVRKQTVAVNNNAAQVTLYKESVNRDTPADVSVTVLDANGQPVTGSVTVTIRPIPEPSVLQDIQVAQTSLVVSDTNSANPAQRLPLDPTKPNSTTVTVSVRGQNTNRPIQGASVILSSSDPDTLWVAGANAQLTEITVLTDAQGQAQATFYTSKKAGTVTITAQLDNQTKTAQITQVPGPALLTLSADPTTIFVRLPDSFTTDDGQTHNYSQLPRKAQVTATLADANENPYPNVTVTFTATVGLINSAAATDNNGKATVDFASLQVPSGGQATITAQATVNGQSLSAQLNVRVRPGPPAKVSVTANPQSLPADGRSTSTITATLLDANDNPVQDGTTVTLQLTSRPSGTVFLPSGSDSISLATLNGQVQATLLAGQTSGSATIKATGSETINGTNFSAANRPELTLPIGVVLQSLQVSAAQVFVSKQDYTSFGGQYGNTLTVTVQVAGGQNLSGVQVALSASDPNVAWNNTNTKGSIVVTTDSNGRAQATYIASQRAGDVVITATLGNQVLTATVKQLPGPPKVQLTANPQTIFVSLQGAQYASLPQQSQIVATVTDDNDNPHPNASVQLTATAGNLAASSGPTDAQGRFITTLTAPTQVPPNNTVTLTANITTQRGETANAQQTLTIQPGPPAVLELAASKLTLSASDSANITATVKDANGNPVPSGSGRTVSVTFTLQVSQANSGKVTLNPTSGTTNNNGQVPTTLTTNNAVADTARVTAEAVETLQATFFRASNQLVIPVGITATLTDLQIATQTLVVSNSNVADPTQRQPLDPAKQNRTLVTVKVSLSSAATSDVSIPVLLLSSDDNTLWQDVANTSRFALKQLTLFVAIPSGQNQGTAQAFFYTSTKRALNIAGEPAVAIRATLDPNFTDFNQPDQAGISITKSGANGIIQQPGPPATIALDLSGFTRAADNVPYLTVNPSNPPTGNITATVRDAVGNPVNGITVNFALSPTNLGSDAGTFTDSNNQTSTGTTDNNGQVTKTLQASNLTTEVTLQVQSGNASATQPIRYSIALSALNITPNPTTIPDDGTTTSLITITGTPNLPDNLKFRLSADLGATLSAGTEGTDQPSLILTVGNGQPSGEGSNEARATLKGPNPDLSQTQPRTITLTANLIVDGLPRTFTQTVTLNPRIQITSNFGLSNNPNRLVVSSSNDTDQTRRVPLDTVAGHNKATITVTLNGSATPNPSFVTFTSNDPNILFVEVDPSNNQEKTNKALGNLSVNFAPVTGGWKAVVNLYASTTAASNLVVQIGVLGVTRSIIFEQVPGLPAIVTVSPDRSVIGVTGHPTLPTSTAVRAIIRDAAGNLVTQPGVTVTFTTDAGTLNPTSAPAVNGVATTTLTSTNATRQVRVIARATAGNAEAVGAATIVFAVGSVSNITLTTDKPQDAQGRVLLDPNDLVRITATFSRTGSVPDGTIPIVTLTGAYGIIQSITPAQSDRSDVIVLNNNTTNVDQEARIRFTVYNEQGLPVSSPEQIVIMKGVTVTPVISLTAGTTTLKVSTSNDTNENNRNALNPGGPSEPTGTTANRTTLTVTLNITGLNANEQVTLTLSSTDLNGLFTVTAAQNGETGPLGRMDINLNADGSGNLNATVQRAYWASTKAGNFVITAEVKRQNGAVIGRASLNITQNPGNPAQVFLTTDPPRLAVSTVTTEPTAARVIATLLDANNNPVPNWWTFFQLQPVPVNMNPDFTDNNGNGESRNIPSVSDGVLDPFAVRTDSGGVAVSLIRSINTCQPVRIRAIADANNNGNLEGSDGPENSYDTVYYVPLTNASAVVDYNSVTRDIIVTVTPATALPPNTAIWVCRYAVYWWRLPFGDDPADPNDDAIDMYQVDNDGDGRFDEDWVDFDAQGNPRDNDGDGRANEDPGETLPPIYYRVIVTEPGRLVVPAFPLGARERGIVNVRIFIYTKDGTMLRIRIDQVQRP